MGPTYDSIAPLTSVAFCTTKTPAAKNEWLAFVMGAPLHPGCEVLSMFGENTVLGWELAQTVTGPAMKQSFSGLFRIVCTGRLPPQRT